ncbi:MAG: hypothetical protein ABFD79_18325 [Phycisphaerales bacterium]
MGPANKPGLDSANTLEEMGVIMGKLFTLLIVFIAGFVSALYYVAPADENYQSNDKAARIVNTINHYASETYHKVSEKVDKFETNDLNASDRDRESSDESYASAQYSAPYDSY